MAPNTIQRILFQTPIERRLDIAFYDSFKNNSSRYIHTYSIPSLMLPYNIVYTYMYSRFVLFFSHRCHTFYIHMFSIVPQSYIALVSTLNVEVGVCVFMCAVCVSVCEPHVLELGNSRGAKRSSDTDSTAELDDSLTVNMLHTVPVNSMWPLDLHV